MKYYIGCSGFHYKEWVGIFYPEKLSKNKWLGFYAERFNTEEINASFYRNPFIIPKNLLVLQLL